jgi:hypothetical protein
MLDFRPGETPSWAIDLFEDDAETIPLDCTGATLAVVETDLGFTPAVAWRDRGTGTATLSMTTNQTGTLQRRRRYWLRLRLDLPGNQVIIPDDIPVLVR